jgi:D-citramalate synthase
MVNKHREYPIPHPEKLHIASLLLKDVKVDRIEVASARVSTGEFEALGE